MTDPSPVRTGLVTVAVGIASVLLIGMASGVF